MIHSDENSEAASGAASSEHSEPESPSNNIDSGKYQNHSAGSPPYDFQAIRYGVDTMYLSYRGDMTADARQRLQLLKEMAQSPDRAHLAQVTAGGCTFMVSDKGRGRYAFLLIGNFFEIQLCDKELPSIPVAYVKVRSQCLATFDILKVEEMLRGVLEQFCVLEKDEKLSRVDLFLDFCCRDSDILQLRPEQFVTRAEVIRPYITDLVPTGWDLGLGSDLSARIYNKTLQIKKSKQQYLEWLWKENGWNGEETIWRVEFQMRRTTLDDFSVNTVSQLALSRAGLWTYLTKTWLRIAIPHPTDSNRSRWETHPLWVGVWDGGCGSVDMPMRKRICHDTAPEIEAVYHALCSPLSSLFALKNLTTFKEAFKWLSLNLPEALIANCSNKGVRLDIYLMDQVKKKIRTFNLRLNNEKLSNPGNFYK